MKQIQNAQYKWAYVLAMRMCCQVIQHAMKQLGLCIGNADVLPSDSGCNGAAWLRGTLQSEVLFQALL